MNQKTILGLFAILFATSFVQTSALLKMSDSSVFKGDSTLSTVSETFENQASVYRYKPGNILEEEKPEGIQVQIFTYWEGDILMCGAIVDYGNNTPPNMMLGGTYNEYPNGNTVCDFGITDGKSSGVASFSMSKS